MGGQPGEASSVEPRRIGEARAWSPADLAHRVDASAPGEWLLGEQEKVEAGAAGDPVEQIDNVGARPEFGLAEQAKVIVRHASALKARDAERAKAASFQRQQRDRLAVGGTRDSDERRGALGSADRLHPGLAEREGLIGTCRALALEPPPLSLRDGEIRDDVDLRYDSGDADA